MSYSNTYRRKKKKKWTFEIITAVAALLLIACAYSGDIDPQRFFPAPFMVLAFMPMLILVFVLLVLAVIWRRWVAIAAIALSLLISLPTVKIFMPFNTSENRPPVPADTTLILKVMTYNVLAFNYNEPQLGNAPSKTMKLILDSNPDVVLLQEGSCRGVDWSEVPSLKPYMAELKSRYPYTYQSNEGLSMISKQSYHLSFGKNMSVRVSPDAKPSPIERMKRSFALRGSDAAAVRAAIDASPANLIVCGDMNDVSTSHTYRVIKGHDLIDAWADVGRGYAYTYNRHGLRFRIDHVLYRGDITALNAHRLAGGSSDHYPLLVEFDIDN